MARKYNHVIRFFESWFVDLEDPEKEFSDSEKWHLIKAIYDCQIQTSLEPLQELPLSIRRALSMATLGEQITAILERADSYRRRGSWQRPQPAAGDSPRAKIESEQRELQQKAREEKRQSEEEALRGEMKKWKAKTPLELYQKQIAAAVAGDEAMRKRFPNWAELARTALKGT